MTPSGSWILDDWLFAFSTQLDWRLGLWIAFEGSSLALEAAWPDSDHISLEDIHNFKAIHAFPRPFLPHKRYMVEFFQYTQEWLWWYFQIFQPKVGLITCSVGNLYLLLHLSVEIFHKTFFKITNRLNMRKTFTGSDNSDHCSILSRKLLAGQNWVTHAVWNYFGLDLNQLVVICQN